MSDIFSVVHTRDWGKRFLESQRPYLEGHRKCVKVVQRVRCRFVLFFLVSSILHNAVLNVLNVFIM